MVEVPLHVINQGNEEAYLAGARRRIEANARKGAAKRFQARIEAEPEFKALYAEICKRAEKGNRFFRSMADAISDYGNLTEKQEATCARIISEEAAKLAEIRARDAGSEFVGSLKERREFTLTITGYSKSDDDWGISYFHAMKDEAGNVFIYRGTVKIGEKGETVTFKATVKNHQERNGVKQTYLNRPTVDN
ncbi:hypothetical protein P106B_72 [Rhizobium phage vB_RglS_P106B]|uniref:Uncharacterized protein n=1 Tax=Rhizobium phage vB_RglS_P106B TaxID=1458697 RepID=W6E8I7_9CAUD|nr:hypothetical protein P106B_72 [Rhizobium phage vB_RglS_P106B]AHJ10755.1 hypothetical protein P106B_72 [Rhizobium phage vB_RglS_P106B]